jgi:nitrate/TMAO reductase-like tetraheme cytochrome c subunit
MKWIAMIVMAVVAGSAWADNGNQAVSGKTVWKKECSSCHIAYPPRFLTAEDWEKLMKGLDTHFGDNASLNADTRHEILAYLKRHAGKGSRHSAKSLRISDTRWFRSEHHEVPSEAWTNPAVRSRAHCTACHINAERGDWSERGVRLPAGLHMDDDDD